jgi:hypothetical protein
MRTLLAITLGLGGCAAGAAGTPGKEWPYAEAHADCAPWDGAATAIVLSETPIGGALTAPYLAISVYRSLSDVGGTTRVEGEHAHSMSARMCPGDGPCIPADGGSVELTPANGTIRGRYTLRLTDGRMLTGSFAAPVKALRVLCG